MIFRRLLSFTLVCLCSLSHLDGHDVGESSIIISSDEENLIVVASLSLPVAATLLPANTSPALSVSTLEQCRPMLLAAASGVCVLADAAGTSLAPERVFLAIREGHALEMTLLYPAHVQPARLRVPFLTSLAKGSYCQLSDLRFRPSTRNILTIDAAECELVPLRK